MAHANGISITKSANGSIKSVTFDLDIYEDKEKLQQFLSELGITTEDEEFERKWATGIPLKEAFRMVHKHIDTLEWEK